jgi:hypothetical protein
VQAVCRQRAPAVGDALHCSYHAMAAARAHQYSMSPCSHAAPPPPPSLPPPSPEHQYTETNLAFQQLKGHDRAVAELLEACPLLEPHLVLLTKRVTGELRGWCRTGGDASMHVVCQWHVLCCALHSIAWLGLAVVLLTKRLTGGLHDWSSSCCAQQARLPCKTFICVWA